MSVPQEIRDATNTFALLSDPTRLHLLTTLRDAGELSVTEICRALGMGQPAVSHHLALMKTAGVILCRRDGKFVRYWLNPAGLGDAAGLLASLAGDAVGGGDGKSNSRGRRAAVGAAG